MIAVNHTKQLVSKGNLGGFDYFKVVAAFLVIAIHISPFSTYNMETDFVFTRIIARMAVPFFLMITGYFVFSQCLSQTSNSASRLLQFIKKTLALYAIAIFFYLPFNIYMGDLKVIEIGSVLKKIIFDGTFYHLWYLPASIMGMLLLYSLRKLPIKVIFAVVIVLYCVGMLGDSYFGLVSNIPFINHI